MTTAYVMLAHDKIDADEVERSDRDVIEARLAWGDNLLAVRHFEPGTPIFLGEGEGDLAVPAEILGASRHQISDGEHVFAPSTAQVRGLAELRTGHETLVVIGEFSVTLRRVPAGRTVDRGVLASLRESAFGSVGASAALHIALLGSLFAFLPALSADDAEGIDRDRLYTMQTLLDNAAERERETPPSTGDEGQTQGADDSASGGQRAAGAEGAMGRPDVRSHGRWSVKGNVAPEDTQLARERAKEEAKTFGLLGLIPTSLSDPDAPVAPFGGIAQGADPESHAGDFWSVDVGDAFGTGLGLSGPGEGGGGHGEGVGINDIGGLGRTLDTHIGMGTCKNPPCDGMGRGHGHFAGAYHPHGISVRPDPHTEVNGHLPAEVIQRIVRQNQGRFRNCYEDGLRRNPQLAGRVAVQFVIDRTGAVSLASDGDSDMPDTAVRACVAKSFYNLSFPAPQGGTVRVKYPILFSPGE